MLAKLRLILQYLPAILAGVLAVEQAVGNSIPGSSKKAIILSAVGAAASVGESVPNDHVQAISSAIDSVVSVLNQTGVFAKAPAAQ